MDLCMFPAGTPPNGTVINFDNPETLVPVLISICVIMTVGAVLFTACRLYANRRKMWWSDCKANLDPGLSVLWVEELYETDQDTLHRLRRYCADIVARFYWAYAGSDQILYSQEILISFVLFFSKTSIFLLFHQIFEVKRPMRIAIRFGIVFSGLLYFTNIPVSSIMSAPHVGETWTSVLFSGRPQKSLIWGTVQSAFSIMLDLFIFILPIPAVVRLHLSTRKKLQLLVVFTTAVVVEAINTDDGTWKYTSLLICTVVENNVAIIVSCTPGFANFTRIHISELQIVKSFRSTFGGSGGGKSGVANKPSWNQEDPNRPRTGRGSGKKANHHFDELSDTFILKSNSDVSGEGIYNMSQKRISPGILRTVDVSQEAHYSGSTTTNGVREPQIQNYPNGIFYYGPSTGQPPAQSVWFYYVPSTNQQTEGPYFAPYQGPNTYTYGNHHSQQTSTEHFISQPPV
ncbi:hypothetical protein VP1G_05744 [Cytospora mali]|uniref:Rhodopsin domain-containing protein n=1 Tax=Cytospora mali TaxID=578113 RepID=A0A194V3G3_CYTMA|nr:hypothetical protein VP1G_05744 [Valsa mali var. pyri (nom. inval.)]